LLNVFAHELHKNSRPQLTAEGIFNSVRSVHRRCRGGYSVVAMINGHGLVGFAIPEASVRLYWGSAALRRDRNT
jgi:amidophosphoribosyltransferase